MSIYKKYEDNPMNGESVKYVQRLRDGAVIPFDVDNSDYRVFIEELNSDIAQLEGADGVLMTAEEVKVFIAKLP